MKRAKLFKRLLIPVMIALILLPPLSCLIFNHAAKQYAYDKASQDLENFQDSLLPLMESSFGTVSPEAVAADSDTSVQVSYFLSQIVPLMARTNGNTQLMILENRMHVVYPRDEQAREAVRPLAEEFVQYIQNWEEPFGGNTTEFTADNGANYLINIYEAPTKSVRIKYLIAYCPTSQIGSWIGKATILVITISSLFVLIIFAILGMTTHSVAQSLHRLCRGAERIGSGSFEEIKPEFSLIELNNLRLAMNQMSEQLMHAEETQRNFLQNVSHELRNPLMSISGYAQGIEQGIFHTPQEAAHTILEESVRLTGVVNSLLTLSRLEGEQPNIYDSVRLIDSIEDCLDRLNGLTIQKGVSLVLRPFDHSVTAYGDEELLGKILDNLLTNAIRYAKTSVTISVLKEKKHISISVADDGNGIDEKDFPHLFERCYKGTGGNFGIGLAIARSAAQKIGGSLEAVNGVNGGAIFTLSCLRYPIKKNATEIK